ncbi:MAG TPA: ClpXP protease specificity-enhancing factor SspB [Hyphomicrobiales bacterium]|nr:ClpXP protease specificity-enhancing factor SspB [Hyphomicrobiales bacterium]
MASDFFRYDLLTQDALRGVIRHVLEEVAKGGLPGEHHFFISFNPNFPGVRLSPRLRQQYPQEMTIVLQHQFWDLVATEQAFEVGLSFGGVGEKLTVPFEAITGFYDPSVQFGLKFEPKPEPAETPAPEPESVRPPPTAAPALTLVPTPPAESRPPDAPTPQTAIPADAEEKGAEIVSLDKFRKK